MSYDFAGVWTRLTAMDAPLSSWLFLIAALTYCLAFIVTAARPKFGVWPLSIAVAAHLVGTISRGLAVEFVPITNKMESFSAASLATGIVLLASWRGSRLYALPLIATSIAALATAVAFPTDLTYPPPLMRTIWYPTHVPMSFFSYAIWYAAGAAALVWFKTKEPRWLVRVDHLAMLGFALWSLSMICGGIWGVVAWGAYFLWDPKVIWSVILWFYYATFVHVRLTPSLMHRPWIRPALALVGVLLVFIAYVGTSFFFGKSSHAFG